MTVELYDFDEPVDIDAPARLQVADLDPAELFGGLTDLGEWGIGGTGGN